MSHLVSQHLPQVTPVSSHIPFFFNGFSNFPIRVIPFTCINQRCPSHRLTPSTHVYPTVYVTHNTQLSMFQPI